MINNNIYALLIGVGDYKKIKITDLPSYRMDVALIGTGLIQKILLYFIFPVMEVLKTWYLAMVRLISKVL